MDGIYYFIDLMHKGKTVNYIILVLYLLTLAVAAERVVYYVTTRYKRKGFNRVLDECTHFCSNGQPIPSELFQCKELQKSYIPALADIFFEYRAAGLAIVPDSFDRAVQQIIAVQERGFVLLSRIAAISPLLGLLGTVTGLMSAFQRIAALGGSVDIAILSGGIWEAMITTATGLVTAIFSFTVYELFDWLNVWRIRDMEQLVSVLTENSSLQCVPSIHEGSRNEAL